MNDVLGLLEVNGRLVSLAMDVTGEYSLDIGIVDPDKPDKEDIKEDYLDLLELATKTVAVFRKEFGPDYDSEVYADFLNRLVERVRQLYDQLCDLRTEEVQAVIEKRKEQDFIANGGHPEEI